MDVYKYKTSQRLVQVFLFIAFFLLFLKSITWIPQDTHITEDDTLADKGSQNKIRGVPYDKRAYALKVDFASEKSGTKIIAQSESLVHLSNIQNNDLDRYMLAPCKTTDWFILSFPENIFIQKVSILSYEDYASTYKHIRISASNYYPSTSFRVLADLELSSSEKEIFNISEYCNQDNNDCWTKYLKVELLDYHRGDNYYCTVTSMHIYGATALEVLENEIEDERYLVDLPEKTQEYSKNTINTAFDGKKDNATFDDTKDKRCSVQKSIEVFDKALIKTSRDVLAEKNSCDEALLKSTRYKFLANLACDNSSEYNRKLVSKIAQRMSNRGKIRQYSQAQCTRFLQNLSTRQSNRFSRMLEHVKLPKETGLFERVIYGFIKDDLLSCDSATFVEDAPVLVCIQSPGLISKFSCFSYSDSKSSTCTLKKYVEWIKMIKNPILRTKVYFWYLGNKKFVTSTSPTRESDSKTIYKISNYFISSLSLENNVLLLSITDKSFKGIKNPDGFLRYITERLDHRLKYLRTLQQKTTPSGDSKGPKEHKSRGKKHVLLTLSERIKMVEFLSTKLNSRVFENERVLNVYLARLVDLKLSLGNFETLLDRVNEWQAQMQSEMGHILRVWGVDRFSIILKRGQSKFHLPGHFGGNFGRFEIQVVTFNIYEFNRNFKSKVCSIDKCKPAGGRCKGLYFAHKLSIFQRVFNKYALITCCGTFGCTCTSTDYDAKSLLLWMPHFKGSKHKSTLDRKFNMYNIKNLFNIHVLTIVFVISQIFWMYQFSRINRLLYERQSSDTTAR